MEHDGEINDMEFPVQNPEETTAAEETNVAEEVQVEGGEVVFVPATPAAEETPVVEGVPVAQKAKRVRRAFANNPCAGGGVEVQRSQEQADAHLAVCPECKRVVKTRSGETTVRIQPHNFAGHNADEPKPAPKRRGRKAKSQTVVVDALTVPTVDQVVTSQEPTETVAPVEHIEIAGESLGESAPMIQHEVEVPEEAQGNIFEELQDIDLDM